VRDCRSECRATPRELRSACKRAPSRANVRTFLNRVRWFNSGRGHYRDRPGDGVVDESEFDVPTRRHPSGGVALLAQARDARQPPGAYDVRTASTYGTGLTTARISTWM
jgi:hypothetical protein